MRSLTRGISSLWSRPIFKDTITTTIFTILGRGVGFFIPLFIAAWYGVGGETDAFFFAYGVIFFLTIIFSSVVGSVIIPFVAEARVNGEDQGKFIGSLLLTSGFGVLLLCLIFAIAGYPLFQMVTGFKAAQLRLVYYLSLETFPLCLFVIWGSLISGVFNAYQAFAHPQLSLGFRALITLILIFLLKNNLGIHAIPLSYVLGEGSRILYLYFRMKKIIGIKAKIALPNKRMMNFLKTASVMMIGTTLLNLSFLVDKTMASWLGVSAVSLLEYGNKLFFMPVVFLGEGLLMVLLSHWSTRSYADQFANLRQDLVYALKLIFIFSMPVALALFFFRYEITELFYGRGVFPRARLPELSQITGMYLIGLTPWLLNRTIIRGILVMKDTFQIVKVAICVIIMKLIFNLLFIYYMGLKGLALSTSVVEIITCGILWISFNSSYKNILQRANGGPDVRADLHRQYV